MLSWGAATYGSSLGSSSGKSCFHIGANCKIFPQDSRSVAEQVRSEAPKNTQDPMDVDNLGKGGKKGKKGKGDGKKGGEGQNQSQNPNSSKDVVCWHCDKHGHLSTERWSNPKNQAGSSGNRNKKTEERHMQRSGPFGTGRTSCSGGTTAATGSGELSGLGIV